MKPIRYLKILSLKNTLYSALFLVGISHVCQAQENLDALDLTNEPSTAPMTQAPPIPFEKAPEAIPEVPSIESLETLDSTPVVSPMPPEALPSDIAPQIADRSDSSNTTVSDMDNPRIPRYLKARSYWSVQASYSPIAYASSLSADGLEKIKFQSYRVGIEYKAIKGRIGTLGLGLHFQGLTPLTNAVELPTGYGINTGLPSFGTNLRYQGYWGLNPWIVPHLVGYLNYNAHRMTYSAYQSFVSVETGGGLAINLNQVDPYDAADFYTNHGVYRTYIVGEYTVASSSGGTFVIAGSSLFFGLRFDL
jgi:hypothetical protein